MAYVASLNTIRAVAAAAFGVPISRFTTQGIDLFLDAANGVRKNAELLHDFEDTRFTRNLDIAGNLGGDFSGVDLSVSFNGVVPNGYCKKIKQIVAVRRQRPNGVYIPLDFTRADIPIERERTELEFSDNMWPENRYPSDADLLARGTSSSVIQRGMSLFIYPGFTVGATDTTVTVTLEGHGWMKDYTTVNAAPTVPEDFIVEHGFDFMKWGIICELNPIFQKFVPRQEGGLPEPEKKRDDAWQRLLLWDSYRIDANVTRSR